MQQKQALPALWLLLLIMGIPQISESVYSPALPSIAKYLNTTSSTVQFTLTICLMGFAIGALFWGRVSDKHGRKPCLLIGLVFFILGCILCYFTQSIEMLMLGRLIQAFGGSVGSVLGQSICRDSFHGKRLGQVYSFLLGMMALFPAFGPIVGGFITQSYGWRNVFVFLSISMFILALCVVLKLPETHYKGKRAHHNLISILKTMIQDRNVIGFGIIEAANYGIFYSYFAEGPFYLIELLGMSPVTYGSTFFFISASILVSGLTSKKLNQFYPSFSIMKWGVLIMSVATLSFSGIVLFQYFYGIPRYMMIITTIVLQTVTMFGFCFVSSNALSLALVNYKWCVGTASSLFGFFYSVGISLCTFGMGLLHNGSLIPMPIYFLSLCTLIAIMATVVIKMPKKESAST